MPLKSYQWVFNYCRQLTVGFIQALLMQTVLGMRSRLPGQMVERRFMNISIISNYVPPQKSAILYFHNLESPLHKGAL